MRRDAFSMPLDLGRELIIDNFAGGGGTSTGLEAAFGRPMATSTTKARMGLVHPLTIPRIALSVSAQVRMVGNSVSPPMAHALVRANFAHEALVYGEAA